MKVLILLVLFCALTIIAVQQNAFADGVTDCDDPHCYVLVETNPTSLMQGVQYKLDTPDLYVDRNACVNVAVSTAWYVGVKTLRFDNQWIEVGVKTGEIIGLGCVNIKSTYFGINEIIEGNVNYFESLVPNGRVDPGENLEVKIDNAILDRIDVTVTTPLLNEYPLGYNLYNNDAYFTQIGIEGSLSAYDEFSSIPMSKFTDVQVKESGSWVDISAPLLILDDSAEGYIGEQCSATSFVMGSVMATDCSVAATNNQIPDAGTYNFDVAVPSTVTVDLHDVDGDFDYLKYTITGLPSYGIATNSTFGALTLGERIPEIDGDSATFDYTATSNPTHDDTIKYTVTDGRTGHTIENVVFMDGVVFTPIAPDKIDDFSYTVSDTTITFDWTEPNDNGSSISFYTIEESDDAESWTQYAIVSGAPFSFLESYGYQQYFRIFANNAAGSSPSSDVLDVYVPDDIPPTVTIIEPTDTEFEENDFIEFIGSAIDDVDGNISELIGWSSDIDGFLGVGESIRINTLSLNTHIITAFAEDMARNSDTDSITITIITPTTSVPDKITNLIVIFDDIETDLILTWDKPSDNESPLEVYEIESRIQGDASWRQDYITDTEITTFSFHGWLGYTYEFQVSARNGEGWGEPSDIVTGYMVDYYPPFIYIYEPDNNDTVGKSFIADGFVSDLNDIQSIDLQLGSDNSTSIPIQQNWVTEVVTQNNGPQTFTVTVTNLDGYTRSTFVDLIVDFEAQETLDRFYDDFESDLSEWENSGQELWEIKTPDVMQIPGFPNTNQVASSDNCDNYCILSMVDAVDLTGHVEPYLSFYRFVDADADFTLTPLPDPDDEGLILYYSDDDGNTWQIIDSWLASQNKADGIWQLVEYSLYDYSGADNFKIRFIAISSSSSEDMEIDEVFIRDDAEPPDTTAPVITLSPPTIMDVSVNTSFVEPGYSAIDDVDGDITGNVLVAGSVDTTTLGTYDITYDVLDAANNPAVQKIRTVNVVDTIPPVFSFVPSDQMFEATELNTPLSESDYGTATATDNYDPSPVISNDAPIEFPLGETIIIWTAIDFSGNNSTDNQSITVQDTINPIITLLGNNPQIIELGNSYAELGANATDNIDGNITANIIIDFSAVNTNATGSYPVMYDVSDYSGNSAITETREVLVIQSNPAPIIISLVADDPDNLDNIYSVDDTITITFDSDTNIPGGTIIQTKTSINDMFTFSESLGRAYSGKWITPDTFTITIKSVKNAGPPLINITNVTISGITPILSSDELSEPSSGVSPELSGDFGIIP